MANGGVAMTDLTPASDQELRSSHDTRVGSFASIPAVASSRRQPFAYMLCGFVGSGKTTHARRLEAEGCVRLSIDELVFERHGRRGVDYDESDYPAVAASARADLDERLCELLADGHDVVLDYGFWSRGLRDQYKRL